MLITVVTLSQVEILKANPNNILQGQRRGADHLQPQLHLVCWGTQVSPTPVIDVGGHPNKDPSCKQSRASPYQQDFNVNRRTSQSEIYLHKKKQGSCTRLKNEEMAILPPLSDGESSQHHDTAAETHLPVQSTTNSWPYSTWKRF